MNNYLYGSEESAQTIADKHRELLEQAERDRIAQQKKFYMGTSKIDQPLRIDNIYPGGIAPGLTTVPESFLGFKVTDLQKLDKVLTKTNLTLPEVIAMLEEST